MPPRKRKQTNLAGEILDGDASSAKKVRSNIPEVDPKEFQSDATAENGKRWNLKLATWNVNGVRAWLDKNGQSYFDMEKPDVLCLQEIKCSKAKIPKETKMEGYYDYWSSAEKEGYAGTALYSKEKPLNVTYGIGKKEHDTEGRVITAEYNDFYLITSYIPNSGRGLVRLDYRSKSWDVDFRRYMKSLEEKKPVILCGDLNVSHKSIDLANPKSNYNKTAGYTQAEIDGFQSMLDQGYIDSFRKLYPDKKGAYSYWGYMGGARARNVGWRLDYFIVSEKLSDNICDSLIRSKVEGSDHCPIVLLLHV